MDRIHQLAEHYLLTKGDKAAALDASRGLWDLIGANNPTGGTTHLGAVVVHPATKQCAVHLPDMDLILSEKADVLKGFSGLDMDNMTAGQKTAARNAMRAKCTKREKLRGPDLIPELAKGKVLTREQMEADGWFAEAESVPLKAENVVKK